MSNAMSIMNKELRAYFLSPVFYVVAFFFLVISGGWFTFLISSPVASPNMVNLFKIMVYLLFPLCPALTMHLISEERRSGTIELLMTYPLRDWQVVMGKYFASLVLFLVMAALTVEFPLILAIYGKPDFGPILTGYIGFLFLGAAFLAVGMLGTALARSQMLAFVISAIFVFGMMIFGAAGYLLGPGRLGNMMEYLPATTHFENFSKGLVDTRDIVFFVSFIGFCLFTAIRVVEINRWK